MKDELMVSEVALNAIHIEKNSSLWSSGKMLMIQINPDYILEIEIKWSLTKPWPSYMKDNFFFRIHIDQKIPMTDWNETVKQLKFSLSVVSELIIQIMPLCVTAC